MVDDDDIATRGNGDGVGTTAGRCVSAVVAAAIGEGATDGDGVLVIGSGVGLVVLVDEAGVDAVVGVDDDVTFAATTFAAGADTVDPTIAAAGEVVVVADCVDGAVVVAAGCGTTCFGGCGSNGCAAAAAAAGRVVSICSKRPYSLRNASSFSREGV